MNRNDDDDDELIINPSTRKIKIKRERKIRIKNSIKKNFKIKAEQNTHTHIIHEHFFSVCY